MYSERTVNNDNHVDEEPCVDVNEIMAIFGDWTLRLDVQMIFSTIYVIIFVVGLIGNGLLIGTIRKRMTVANVFLLNLATSDLLLCITALPITPVLAFVKRWIFGNVMCKLVPLCQGISVLISSYCLCLIAVDRYRSIVTPLKEPWTVYQAQDWPQDTRIKLFYGSALLVVQYLIPVSIMTFCYWKILQKVRQDWIVSSGSMLTEAQQAQTSIRKRRVMYVLILMVSVFMASWMPLTIVNILRDIGVGFLDIQMYFKLLNAHAIAMTSIVSNPLLYFWMSKRHRRALKDDMFWFTNVRRQQQMGLLEKFAPSPSLGILYRKSLERHLLSTKYNPYRRGTLADPTCMSREKALQEMHANCFLLVPLMPLCVPPSNRSSSNAGFKDPSVIFRQRL
ncbi:7 transmembrane receptor (rhodopsin family) domain-containing protein [Ditylenchus destructor]|nr:7 transmembrane receptor (rhodopsin family) domain-containing protein [Ditylenchus destructor]